MKRFRKKLIFILNLFLIFLKTKNKKERLNASELRTFLIVRDRNTDESSDFYSNYEALKLFILYIYYMWHENCK